MGSSAPSLYEHLGGQLRILCENLELAPNPALAGVRDLLAPIGGRALTQPPLWPSGVSDDHTPIEFSIACDAGAPPALRILGETIAPQPSPQANLDAALRLVDSLAVRHDLALDRFDHVRQVFLGGDPQGEFSVWFSLVHRPDSAPDVKIYFDPNAQGRNRAPQLVERALERLQLAGAYRTTLAHAVRPGQLGIGDRFSFFALDLHGRPHSRVKVYLAHENATVRDVVRAAGAVEGVDGTQIEDFLALTGCTGPLTKRPLMSGYSFVQGDTDRPSTYSLYLPIRDYVSDDEQAWERVRAVFDRYGLDVAVIDKAISSVARRPLRDGVGLIAHVSLRLSAGRSPGVTVYLSSEAYAVAAPRPRLVGAVAAPPAIRLVPSGDDGPLRIPVRSASQCHP
jgi:DMATS type aromatic prenyltransferase